MYGSTIVEDFEMKSDCVEWRPHLMRGCDKKVLIGSNGQARFFERPFEFGSLTALDFVHAGVFGSIDIRRGGGNREFEVLEIVKHVYCAIE